MMRVSGKDIKQRHSLAVGHGMKHIYAHIHNSAASPKEFEKGAYEGKRVVILGGTQEDAIVLKLH